MNELPEYSVENYHINKTHCVFVSLEGTHLRIQRPKNPVPKRAMWDESIPKPQFIHQRHYDLPGANVYLLPTGLVKKRIWSKKYPICISLPSKSSKKDTCEEGSQVRSRHFSANSLGDNVSEKEADSGFEIVSEKSVEKVLYLFARTGREKEEWFKKFSAAAAGKPLGE